MSVSLQYKIVSFTEQEIHATNAKFNKKGSLVFTKHGLHLAQGRKYGANIKDYTYDMTQY